MARTSSKEIPLWGRKEKHVVNEMDHLSPGIEAPHGRTKMGTPEDYAATMPIGTNQVPSVVRGIMVGGMPNNPRMAKGRLTAQMGKFGKNTGFPIQ